MGKVNCEICGLEFERLQGEINRAKKLGRRTYCSRRCCGLDNIGNVPEHARGQIANIPEESKRPRWKQDALSPFRWHLHRMRTHSVARKRPGDVQVNVQDLKEVWDLQGGRCPYTGWKLINPETTSNYTKLPKTPDRASLDRIDSSLGYTKTNIQFVSLMAQYAKNDFPESSLVDFCQAVVKARGSSSDTMIDREN